MLGPDSLRIVIVLFAALHLILLLLEHFVEFDCKQIAFEY
jgi:hypothetical protein